MESSSLVRSRTYRGTMHVDVVDPHGFERFQPTGSLATPSTRLLSVGARAISRANLSSSDFSRASTAFMACSAACVPTCAFVIVKTMEFY